VISLPQRAFVTGATGFIGSRLLSHLHSAGWQIAVLARPQAALTLAANPIVSKSYAYDGGTTCVVDAVAEFKPNVVFHLASLFLASHDSTQLQALVGANILFGTQLVEAMKMAGSTALVNTGTAWQNDLSGAYSPVNLYAATKQAFEDILTFYSSAANINVITLRLYDSYGPGDTRRKLLRLLLESLKTGVPLGMSPGDQIVDLVHVDDICRAFLSAAELAQRQSGEEVYAVSGGQRRTLQQVAATLEDAAGRKLPVHFGARPHRDREVMLPWLGPQLPDWKPQISLLEGFKMLLAEEALI
jgi:nucleoside-diphosphate-sugar epimerase